MNLWQAGGWILRGGGGGRGQDGCAGRAYFKELFVLRFFVFCSVLACFFLPDRCIMLPSGHFWECLWSSRGAFPLPCLPKKTKTKKTQSKKKKKSHPATPSINTQFGFSHPSPHVDRSPIPITTAGPTNSSTPLLTDARLDHMSWFYKWNVRWRNLPRRYRTRGATGMQKESSASGNIQRKKKKTMEDQGESWQSFVFILLPKLSKETTLLKKRKYRHWIKAPFIIEVCF